MKGALRKFLDYLGGHGPLVLTAMLVILLGTWLFIAMADYETDRRQARWDQRVLRRIRLNPGPAWLEQINEEITHLGGPVIIGGVCVIVGGYLLLDRRYWQFGVLFVAIVSGAALTVGLKHVIGRESPGGGPQSSFPSGHSMMASIAYLTLGTILAQITRRRMLKFYIVSMAIAVPLLVGISRIYLRLHWPTDVFAGWAAGLVWALICWVVSERIRYVRLQRLEAAFAKELS